MPALQQHAPIVLASGSTIRQQMLKAVGLTFSVVPSGVDEDQFKAAPGDSLPELAITLATAKAMAVSKNNPEAYTIGADQLCIHNGHIISKPSSYDNAEAQLIGLSGKTHMQCCGVALVRDGTVLWQHSGKALLTMRDLTPAEIRAYVAADAPLSSCGSYKFEGLGRHLFACFEGDQDVIQGLPLVPLLAELHARGVISLG